MKKPLLAVLSAISLSLPAFYPGLQHVSAEVADIPPPLASHTLRPEAPSPQALDAYSMPAPEALDDWSLMPFTDKEAEDGAHHVFPEERGKYAPDARGLREGTLICNSEPPGAAVYLDGEHIGETPARKERVPEGEHTVVMKKPGYETGEARVTVKKGVTLTVDDMLVEARGSLELAVGPPGTIVSIDGREAGVTPLTVGRISEGPHELTLSREGYEGRTLTLDFARGERKRVDERLRRLLLVVRSCEDGAGGAAALQGALDSLGRRYRVKALDLDAVCSDLRQRRLEESSPLFLREPPETLSLEQVAVLAGVMEREDCALALAAGLAGRDGALRARLGLYGVASPLGDTAEVCAVSVEGLAATLSAWLARFSAPPGLTVPAAGVRLAPAEAGVGVVRVLPGHAAEKAGLKAGDVIITIDGAPASGPEASLAALLSGESHALTVRRDGVALEAAFTPEEAPAEVPLGSPDVLYNLALAELLDGPSGWLADINAGNMFMRQGDYASAAEKYLGAEVPGVSGICEGTMLYRLGLVFEKMEFYDEAAKMYRRAVEGWPDATLISPDGPPVAPLALDRLRAITQMMDEPSLNQ